MRPCQAIIFDMDGVIVDSEEHHERAFLEVVREIGFGDKLQLRFADFIGQSDQNSGRPLSPAISRRSLRRSYSP